MLNSKALAASASAAKVYVEDVFSTWLYTGNGSTQTITNGIDLSGKGGMVWIKSRTQPADHFWTDTARGATKVLRSSTTQAEATFSTGLTSFSTSGFALGSSADFNASGESYASWTFRKAEKFFDVVTYTGNGTLLTLNHNLGSTPGCIIIKRTDTTSNWPVYHRSLSADATVYLNTTTASVTRVEEFGSISSTTFQVGDSGGASSQTNASGGTYVAYLFAHDAGGFGDSGNDNVVSCGSYTGNGSTTGPVIDLGWEPQWVLIKYASGGGYGSWLLVDNMRGWANVPSGNSNSQLYAEASLSEDVARSVVLLNNGFQPVVNNLNFNSNGATYIYIAIRRGPMKTPTDATKVFTSALATVSSLQTTWTTNFPVDLALFRLTAFTQSIGFFAHDRIRGASVYDFGTASTAAESTGVTVVEFDRQTTFLEKYGNTNGRSVILEAFRRAPGFFDVVAYTGTGANRTVSHNLGVVPELMIVKIRNDSYQWVVNSQSIAADSILVLNGTSAELTSNSTVFNGTRPTASVFSVGTAVTSNGSAKTYIAYLFATCPGVSKCFNFTGTGTTLQIDCGFTNGARFVMIKRTDSTGDWYVWDSARGIISGNDPYLLLNSTSAEVTNTDYIDPYSAGFEISSTAPAAINANGGSYIGLAIA